MGWNIHLPNAEWYDVGDSRLENLLYEVCEEDVVALDTETTGLNVWKDQILFWSLAWGTHRRVCMPAATLPLFRVAFEDATKRWVFANAKYDMHMLANSGVHIAGTCVDVAVMHALLYEERPHGLKDMAEHILGWRWSDFFDTFSPKTVPDTTQPLKKLKSGGLSQPTRRETIQEMLLRCAAEDLPTLVDYASNDAYGTLRLYEALLQELRHTPTDCLYREWIDTMEDLFFKTEAPFTKVLWNCERNGIYTDRQYLQELRGPLQTEGEALQREMSQLWVRTLQEKNPRYLEDPVLLDDVGLSFNPNSVKQLIFYFHTLKGLKPIRYTKGGKRGIRQPAVDKGVLEMLASDGDTMAELVLQSRKISKLVSTYIDGIDEHLDPQGRIHTRFNQDIARCLPAGELVLTHRGYLPVEQVRIGDNVLSHTGVPRMVVETSTHAPKPIYRVTLSNGLVLRTTGNHEYRTGETWTRADALTPGQPVTVHSAPEEWRRISYEGWEVSSWGRVRNAVTGTIRALQAKGAWGHLKVTLYRNGAQDRGQDKKDFSVHRLVAAAFGTNNMTGEVRHLNGIAWDNTAQNLCFGTSYENRQDALKHGTLSQRRAGRTTLTEEAVKDIRATARPPQPSSSTAKLDHGTAAEVRHAHTLGESVRSLAKRYGVSYPAIDNIVKGRTYTTSPDTLARPARYFAEKYGVSEGYVREVQNGAKWKDEDYIEGAKAAFFEARVTSVCIEPDETTYGLTVEVDHSHVTGGIVTHNTGRLSSSSPNLQNIPTPEKDRYQIRGAFQPQPGTGNVLIVGDYCVTPTTRVLTADLHWVPAGDVTEGTELIGFDEELRRNAAYRRSNVERVKRLKKPCVRLHMSNGAVLECSTDHQWVVGGGGRSWKRRVRAWVRADELEPGDQIAYFCPPWEPDLSRDAGYLAGILDGEGWVAACGKVGFAQKPNACLSECERILEAFPITASRRSRPTDSVQSVEFYGNKGGLCALGILRPPRLLKKAHYLWENRRLWGASTPRVTVTRIEPIGEKDVVALQTSTRTFIAEGFLSHNCQLEMRLLAAATVTDTDPIGAKEMIQIFLDGKDIHMGNAAMVFGPIVKREHGWDLTYEFLKEAKKIDGLVKEGKLPKEARTERVELALLKRNQIKSVGFGLNYGMKEGKLARQLGISKEEAKDIIDAYLGTYPAVSQFYETAIKETVARRFSYTLLGRRRHHPGIESPIITDRWAEERKAVNNQIQGTAADAVRLAMINCSKAQLDKKYGCKMLLQVHDELVFECPGETAEAAKAEIQRIMEHPFPTDLAVPLEVSLGIGPSWNRAK